MALKNLKFSKFTNKLWEKIGAYPHHGFAISLASLRTKNSAGIGEYLDILSAIDFCKKIDFDCIQLLPLNDTGNQSSPYSAISSCALSPIFLSLHSLPYLQNFPNLFSQIQKLKNLNQDKVNFPLVLKEKTNFLRNYLAKTENYFLQDSQFLQFQKEHPFLKPYAVFKCLYEKFGFVNWMQWPKTFQNIDSEKFQKLSLEFKKEMLFHEILQFLCFCQLKQVKTYAEEQKVLIKGDIPILVSFDSCDVWYHKNIFDLSKSAGAPPDAYSEEGQNWSLPLFSYDELKKTNYRWWQERLLYASHFYDIYRIDHVVGLFRIYAIENNKTAKEGFFIPSDPSTWIEHGKIVLENLLSFGSMLPIAEDLGCIPDGVRPTLTDLGICGTKVMRWERRFKEDGSFIPLNEYPKLSLTTVSTHDSETLASWWQDLPEESQKFAHDLGLKYTPDFSLHLREEVLHLAHSTPSLFHINLLGEYLALKPELVAKDPKDERINIPGTTNSKNWAYRMKPFFEDLLEEKELIKKIKNLSRNCEKI